MRWLLLKPLLVSGVDFFVDTTLFIGASLRLASLPDSIYAVTVVLVASLEAFLLYVAFSSSLAAYFKV